MLVMIGAIGALTLMVLVPLRWIARRRGREGF
jgi:hypothetical protein